MAFPTTLDSFATKVDSVDDVQAADINNLQTAVVSLEAKVGADNSAVTTSIDYKLTNKVKKYDSGWFAVAKDTAYTKAHGLGAVPDVVMIYVSNTADGSGEVTASGYEASERCTNVADLDATNIVIRTGAYGVATYRDSAGNLDQPASGYCKIVAIKFN